MNLYLEEIADYLDAYLERARFPDDQNGIYIPSDRPVRRLGVALEPWQGIRAWVQQEDLQALFLHRPWRLEEYEPLSEIGILSYHLAFDAHLTFGFNPRLAAVLGMNNLTPFAWQKTFPLGMSGDIPPTAVDVLLKSLVHIFGVTPLVKYARNESIHRLAVVGALNDTLVREAAAQGVQLAITGEWRQAAQKAVQDTAMIVIAIGHEAGEWWGLRTLAQILRERWSDLEVIIAPLASHFPDDNGRI